MPWRHNFGTVLLRLSGCKVMNNLLIDSAYDIIILVSAQKQCIDVKRIFTMKILFE